ncbi:MAG: type II secretion system protein [Candidatus Riflebacteria bacterium]
MCKLNYLIEAALSCKPASRVQCRQSFVRHKGFTLIEALVVVTIASLFSAILFRFYFQSNATQTRLIENLQMQSSVVTGVNKTLREIRTGTAFVYPSLNEDSSILVFADFDNNHKAIYPLENADASKEAGKKIYDLCVYTTDTKTLSPSSPAHDPARLKVLCSDVENLSFRLNSANSVAVNLKFCKGGRTFQVVSEGALMNSGDAR